MARAGFVAAGSRLFESQHGLSRVGIPVDRQYYLDEPDGRLQESISTLAKRITALAAEHGIDRIVSLGADGYTGHTDHQAAHVAASAAIAALRLQNLDIEHASLNSTGEGRLRRPATVGAISRKLAAMACHKSQYPVAPFSTGHTSETIWAGYAIDRTFWSTFVCRNLITKGETYDLL